MIDAGFALSNILNKILASQLKEMNAAAITFTRTYYALRNAVCELPVDVALLCALYDRLDIALAEMLLGMGLNLSEDCGVVKSDDGGVPRFDVADIGRKGGIT